ncbi:MAG TPA: hypothetical protein VFE70_05085 [Candidatus Elarobacter sp.]|jgi:hypothetical protein|nr:hypothetical protein [Candidatus Elarobacter sp.]
MNTDRTNPDKSAGDEPGLTDKNTETIRGEETLADEGTIESKRNEEPGIRATPARTSYGAAGGTTDATEEGGDGTGI